jgi:hypothetical protein
VFGARPVATDKKIWRGEGLKGKKILLHGEGGYGDEIINVRFARNFKDRGAFVTVSCSRTLMPLFRTISFIDSLIDRDGAAHSDFDYWVPAMSAPLVLGLEYEELDGFRYIPRPSFPDGGKLKVGLKFSGNPEFEHEQYRLFPPELMTGLQDIDADFYSLQKENIPELGRIADLSGELCDWLDTARIVSGLDLVITSCTAIAHLSAAMGVPTWVIVPVMPYYVWALPGSTSPWHHSARLYRQFSFGKWEEPFIKIRSDLNDLCKSHGRKSPVSLYRKAG